MLNKSAVFLCVIGAMSLAACSSGGIHSGVDNPLMQSHGHNSAVSSQRSDPDWKSGGGINPCSPQDLSTYSCP